MLSLNTSVSAHTGFIQPRVPRQATVSPKQPQQQTRQVLASRFCATGASHQRLSVLRGQGRHCSRSTRRTLVIQNAGGPARGLAKSKSGNGKEVSSVYCEPFNTPWQF